MDNFPETLPGPVLDTMAWKPQENRIRSQMEMGMAKTRRRFTAVPEDFTCALALTTAQLLELLDFHDNTCATVLPFLWHDFRRPDSGMFTTAYRFKRRPEHQSWGHAGYQVTLELELIPSGILGGMGGGLGAA